jgi:RimJ/RimL family protein N-acetyltransferase
MAFPWLVQTERLTLRRFEESDGAAFFSIWADPDVWRSLGAATLPDAGFALQRLGHHLDHWREFGFGLWAVEERASGEVAGWVGATHPLDVPGVEREVEIGWTLRRPFRGRGLATEAANAAVAACFAALDTTRVISLIRLGNAGSIAVARRLGMTHEWGVVHPGIGEELAVFVLRRPVGAATAAGRGAPPAA